MPPTGGCSPLALPWCRDSLTVNKVTSACQVMQCFGNFILSYKKPILTLSTLIPLQQHSSPPPPAGTQEKKIVGDVFYQNIRLLCKALARTSKVRDTAALIAQLLLETLIKTYYLFREIFRSRNRPVILFDGKV